MDSHKNNFNLIRLLAASQVLIVHVANHLGLDSPLLVAVKMFPGVPIFFFISGYLIYSSFDRLTPKGWKAFYLNRVVRIYPGLIVCTLCSIFAAYLTGYFRGREINPVKLIGWLAGQVTIFQFYNPPFMRDFGTGVLNGALWTVSVEVQFYLLVPVLYFLLRRQKPMWAAILLVSVIANLADRLGRDWTRMGWKLLAVSFVPWVFMFLVGFGLSSRPDWQRRVLRLNGWVLVAAFVLSMVAIPDLRTNSSNSMNLVSFLILAMMLLKVAFADLGEFGRLFYKTDLSYGIYLYHIPIINVVLFATSWGPVARAVAVVVATVVMASLSWFLVEKPALELKKRYPKRNFALVNEPGAL